MNIKRFEIWFKDLQIKREWQFMQTPAEYKVAFFHDMLLRLPSDVRYCVISIATLIVEAADFIEDV